MMPSPLRLDVILVVPWLPTARAVACTSAAIGGIELPAGEGMLSIRPAEMPGADSPRLRWLELMVLR
jgi:hypothetical protein